jgi:hypothetical protein
MVSVSRFPTFVVTVPCRDADRILAELVGGHADRVWDRRMRELIRPDLLMRPVFAVRRVSVSQAGDPYGLVSERQG